VPRTSLAGGSALLLVLSAGCASAGTSGSDREIKRFALPVFLYSAPSCPYTPIAEVRAIDPNNFNHLGVVEQALRLDGDAVIHAQTEPGQPSIPVTGTVIRFTDPDCKK